MSAIYNLYCITVVVIHAEKINYKKVTILKAPSTLETIKEQNANTHFHMPSRLQNKSLNFPLCQKGKSVRKNSWLGFIVVKQAKDGDV